MVFSKNSYLFINYNKIKKYSKKKKTNIIITNIIKANKFRSIKKKSKFKKT